MACGGTQARCGDGGGRGEARAAPMSAVEGARAVLASGASDAVHQAVRLRMAADRVRGGYPRFSGFRVSGSVFGFHPRICGFGYPKYFGFGAGL